jgi:hypothetical protein
VAADNRLTADQLAEPVRADAGHLAIRSVAGSETRHIKALYRQWHRRAGDVEALRELATPSASTWTKPWSPDPCARRFVAAACPLAAH